MGSEATDAVEELVLRLGDLSVTVRRTSSSASSGHSPSGASLAGSLTPGPAEAFSAVPPWTAEWRREILLALTPERLEQVALGPASYLQHRLRAASGAWTARARIARALRAGVSAGDALAETNRAVIGSPPLDIKNQIYVVLRGAPGHQPGWTISIRVYRSHVVSDPAEGFHIQSVSHAFPSRSEAEAFVIGARVQWPEEYARTS